MTWQHGEPEDLVTDGLRSCRAALKDIGAEFRQVTGRWENNRVEDSHLPFRRRGRHAAVQAHPPLQTVAAVHRAMHRHFSAERSRTSRDHD
ncbi:DDE-type integrase/transposase/recombinase [Rubellimicrobium aerolatum]|uniref:DDE-type integrase/transposase/recombinase n=1 Tax=Rubellimicrobium aerolatum TaxID=490979 RepID=A0ABW0SGV9_9RHOB